MHPRFRTPHLAIITVAVLLFILAASGSFRPLAVFSNAARLLTYLAVCVGALRLRWTRDPVPGAFRAPGGVAIPVLAAVCVLWILHYSNRIQMAGLSATTAVAVGYYFLRHRSLARRQPPTEEEVENAVGSTPTASHLG